MFLVGLALAASLTHASEVSYFKHVIDFSCQSTDPSAGAKATLELSSENSKLDGYQFSGWKPSALDPKHSAPPPSALFPAGQTMNLQSFDLPANGAAFGLDDNSGQVIDRFVVPSASADPDSEAVGIRYLRTDGATTPQVLQQRNYACVRVPVSRDMTELQERVAQAYNADQIEKGPDLTSAQLEGEARTYYKNLQLRAGDGTGWSEDLFRAELNDAEGAMPLVQISFENESGGGVALFDVRGHLIVESSFIEDEPLQWVVRE